MVGLAFALPGLSVPSLAQDIPPVRIGILGPLSGPFEPLGRQIERGVRLALAADGRSAEIILADDGCEEGQGRDAGNRLIGAQVDIVIGGVCWRPALAARDVLNAQGVPFLASGVRYPGLTEEGYADVLRVNGRDDGQAGVLADAVLSGALDSLVGGNATLRPIVLLYDEGSYGRPLAEETQAMLLSAGVSLALFEPFDAQSGLDRAAVRAQAEVPGLVIILAGQADTALMISALRSRMPGIAVLAGDSALTAEFPLLAGPAAEGVVFARPTEWRGRAWLEGHEGPDDPLLGLVVTSLAATQVALAQIDGLGAPYPTVLGPLTFSEVGEADLPSFELWQWRDGLVWPFLPGGV
jgi:branched-chain amino acid transport system substrate-binding protein